MPAPWKECCGVGLIGIRHRNWVTLRSIIGPGIETQRLTVEHLVRCIQQMRESYQSVINLRSGFRDPIDFQIQTRWRGVEGKIYLLRIDENRGGSFNVIGVLNSQE